MRYADLAVILAYLAGITWFGARFRSSQKSLRDYFLGGRKTPWRAMPADSSSYYARGIGEQVPTNL